MLKLKDTVEALTSNTNVSIANGKQTVYDGPAPLALDTIEQLGLAEEEVISIMAEKVNAQRISI